MVNLKEEGNVAYGKTKKAEEITEFMAWVWGIFYCRVRKNAL